jgi:hypothetical protein
MSVHIRTTRRYIPEDRNIQNASGTILLHHCFIVWHQLSTELPLFVLFFSENYFIIQGEVYWSTAQDTPHPFVACYSQNLMTDHISFVVISDCLKNDNVAVYVFQSTLCSLLSSKFNNSAKISCFHDGAVLQHKRRKHFIANAFFFLFISLC